MSKQQDDSRARQESYRKKLARRHDRKPARKRVSTYLEIPTIPLGTTVTGHTPQVPVVDLNGKPLQPYQACQPRSDAIDMGLASHMAQFIVNVVKDSKDPNHEALRLAAAQHSVDDVANLLALCGVNMPSFDRNEGETDEAYALRRAECYKPVVAGYLSTLDHAKRVAAKRLLETRSRNGKQAILGLEAVRPKWS